MYETDLTQLGNNSCILIGWKADADGLNEKFRLKKENDMNNVKSFFIWGDILLRSIFTILWFLYLSVLGFLERKMPS